MADSEIVTPVVTGVIAFITGGGLVGVIQAWWQKRRDDRHEARDNRKEFFDSYDKQIASALARGDEEEAARIRKEHEAQLEAWRAQQDFEIVAPREISTDKDHAPLSDAALARIEKIEELLEASKNLSASFLSADDYFLRGNANYQAGRHDDALADYGRALELRADHAATLMNRGVTLDELGRHDDALADYGRALALRPDDAATLYNRGVTYQHMGRYDDALADYDRALALRPDDAGALNNRGVTYTGIKRYDDALADYGRALALRPDHAGTLYNRACLYAVQSMANEAVAELARAIDGDEKYRPLAREDSDFDNIRGDPRFQALVSTGDDDAPKSGDGAGS